MDYNMSDTVTGLGAFNAPRLLRNRRADTHGNVSIKAGRSAIDTGLSGLGAAWLDSIQSGLNTIKDLGKQVQESVTIGKQIQTIVSPPKTKPAIVPIKPLVTANVTGSPYGVPTGSTELEPQLRDQTTVDGRKPSAIAGVPTAYLIAGGAGVLLLTVVLLATRRPAY